MKNYTSTIKTQRSQSVAERQLSKVIESRYNFLGKKDEMNNLIDENTYKIKYKYYKVLVKCGHVGMNKYVLMELAIKARNGVEAAEIARKTPRVKHENIDFIRNMKEINKKEYEELYENNRNNPYFKVTNIQEQRQCELNKLKIYQEENISFSEQYKWDKKYSRKDKVNYIKKKNKIREDTLKNHFDYDYYY